MGLADLFGNVDKELEAKTFQAVGHTVIALQYFELVLAPLYAIHKHVIKTKIPLPPFAQDANWKQPLTAVVNELETAGRIDGDFAKRLRAYAEDRHVLIHRWVREKGDVGTNEALTAMAEHAVKVFVESRELVATIIDYVNKVGPDGAVDVDDYRKRMENVFKVLR